LGNEGNQAQHFSVTKLLCAKVNYNPQMWGRPSHIFVVPYDMLGRREKVPVPADMSCQRKTLHIEG